MVCLLCNWQTAPYTNIFKNVIHIVHSWEEKALCLWSCNNNNDNNASDSWAIIHQKDFIVNAKRKDFMETNIQENQWDLVVWFTLCVQLPVSCVGGGNALGRSGRKQYNTIAFYVPNGLPHHLRMPNVNTTVNHVLQLYQKGQCVFVCTSCPHLFQRSSSSPPQPQNALGNPLIFLNCLTIRPLTPPKNSLYGSLGGTIIHIEMQFGVRIHVLCNSPKTIIRTHM